MTIYHGNSVEVLKTLDPESVDLVFTSPSPFGFGGIGIGSEKAYPDYINNLHSLFEQVYRVVKPTGSLWVNLSVSHIDDIELPPIAEYFVIAMKALGWIRRSNCYWVRTEKFDYQEDYNRFARDVEYLFFFTKSKNHYFNNPHKKVQSSVFYADYKEPRKNEFESGFPEKIIERCISLSCPPNGVVLDPLADCYDKETEVLTNNGFKLFKDLDRNDLIADITEDDNIQFVEPIRYVEYWYSGEMYSIQHESLDLLVTPRHNIVYREHHKDYHEVQHIKDIKYRWINIPCQIKNYVGTYKEYIEIPVLTNLHKNTSNIIQLMKLNMNLFLEFLGYFISEGSTSQYKYSIQISQTKPHIREKIEKVLDQLPYRYLKFDDRYRFNNKQLHEYLRPLGKQKERYIPKEFLNLDKKQLNILFQSLMNGDGTRRRKSFEYYTISKQLADDVAELALKLGYAVTIRSKVNKGGLIKGRQINSINLLYIVCITDIKERKIDTYNKITKEEYNGNVYCVEVPHHKLIVKRNGKICICGNSGTTGVVAKRMGRDYIMIDIDYEKVLAMRGRLGE